MAVPVGGEGQGVELRSGRGRGGVLGQVLVLGLRLSLRGGHVDLLPADGIGGGLRDGLHAGNLVDDLCQVGKEGCAVALMLGIEAINIEFGEQDGRGGGGLDGDLSIPVGGGLCLRGLRRAGGWKLEKKRRAKTTGCVGELLVRRAGDAGQSKTAVVHDLLGVGLHQIGRVEEAQLEGFVLPLGCVWRGGLSCGGER